MERLKRMCLGVMVRMYEARVVRGGVWQRERPIGRPRRKYCRAAWICIRGLVVHNLAAQRTFVKNERGCEDSQTVWVYLVLQLEIFFSSHHDSTEP